ncbi:MAG: biopolymer transporter ExbD [Paludibacteraceae bacterium]|jgi:biopolymer transport protein ExbD|nr:biopolymer transporter ExbD [Paludibacteraceae bacterium]MDI9536885.1 biopolymer transporter ExbD [Bacteroidota bacterium]OQC33716.1 MAG: Biopolymer transport protein ExbD/TolR [Bacteroidetes bacterium ADurb.Bin057]MBP9039081.1 biopolymer transporter ExbD [Paludibacteraceae bacterium]HOA46151.1 biopolymer transporter ExbD [Paludibacteraceae bacterium]
MGKREVQEINASSMADIAFLLLIFFLVTTTMSVDSGLSRQLPPPLPPDMEKPNVEVKERNIFVVLINSQNQLLVQGELLDIKQLKTKAKEFIKNEANSVNLPEILPVEVTFEGGITETVMTTKNHIISLQNDVGTQYQKYIEVQNELVAAYNEIRNEYSTNRFGSTYAALSEENKKAVQDIYPQKISEAEPKKYGGNK